MSLEDRDKWDGIYKGRADDELPAAAELLVRFSELIPRAGAAIDVAGGRGRNGLWLAARGLEVTIADISPVGLELAEAEATRRGVALRTLAVDIESDDLPQGPWDVVLCFHYLYRPLIRTCPSLLAPGGLFIFCQPTLTNLERHEKPSGRFLLDPGELPTLVPEELELVHYAEGWNVSGRHEAEFIGRLPHIS